MSTNLVTRLVCENCGHIFEPGEIGFYSDDEEVWCGNTTFMPIKTPVIHPWICPNCNTEFETIQTYDNIFKRIVSQSAADQAKATAKCDCTTYVTIEESRMRFERYRNREKQKERYRNRERRKEPVQLPIAIVVELPGYFSYTKFSSNFLESGKTNLTLKEIRAFSKEANGTMEYCIPESDMPVDPSNKMAEDWGKVGLEDQCGYFSMERKDMIDKISIKASLRDVDKYKIIFKPFYLKVKGD